MKYKSALEAIYCILNSCDISTKNEIIATLYRNKREPKGILECATVKEAENFLIKGFVKSRYKITLD